MGSRKAAAAAVFNLGLDLGHGFLQFGVSHGEAQAGCFLGHWEIPAGLHGGCDRAQRPLWTRFVDSFFLCSSYLHCKWATLEELEKDPRISQKIKRFRNKQAQMKHIFTEVRAERGKQLCWTPAHLGPVRWLSRPRAERCLWHLPAPGPKFRAGSGQAGLAVPALPELCCSSVIPGCCPEPCLCPLADTVAMPRQQRGTLSFQAGLNKGTAQESERVGMLEPRGRDSALNTRGVTGRGMGRVTNVTCQALATLEALLDGREGSVQCWRCFHGGAEMLWERGSYKYLGLGQLLPALLYKQINLV